MTLQKTGTGTICPKYFETPDATPGLYNVALQVKDLTGDGHTTPILKEVNDQVLLGRNGLVGSACCVSASFHGIPMALGHRRHRGV